MAVSGNGRLAVSASWDHTPKVWELASGEVVVTLTCDASVDCCTYADARTVVAGDALGRVHVLRLENAEGY